MYLAISSMSVQYIGTDATHGRRGSVRSCVPFIPLPPFTLVYTRSHKPASANIYSEREREKFIVVLSPPLAIDCITLNYDLATNSPKMR